MHGWDECFQSFLSQFSMVLTTGPNICACPKIGDYENPVSSLTPSVFRSMSIGPVHAAQGTVPILPGIITRHRPTNKPIDAGKYEFGVPFVRFVICIRFSTLIRSRSRSKR